MTTDEQTWADLAAGKLTGTAAAAKGTLQITGDPQAVARMKKIFSRTRVLAQAEAVMRNTTAR